MGFNSGFKGLKTVMSTDSED